MKLHIVSPPSLYLWCTLIISALFLAFSAPDSHAAEQAPTTAPEQAAQNTSAVQAQASQPLADGKNETDSRFGSIVARAAQAAESAYHSSDGQVPDFLRSLPLDKWQDIRFKPEHSLWRGEGPAFIARFFAPGSIFARSVSIHIIDDDNETHHAFSPAMFDFGKLASEVNQHSDTIGFAGFRLLQPAQPPVAEEEFASFIGATFFRSKGKHAGYGVFARGLALNLGEPEGEEFPYFNEFWLVKPKIGDQSLTVYALLDSPRMTGAYKFVITPGTSTTMDVAARLFTRAGVDAPKKIGLAPISSMFLFSESGGTSADDYRPEVHNSDGLLYTTDDKSWFWRPLTNPARLSGQIFPMENPVGFGLMQRDANFDHYLDIKERFDRRSSLWVEPKDNWGTGHIELIEIPTKTDVNSNIHAFWVPAPTLSPEGAPAAPTALRYDYRLYWMTPGVSPHALGRAMSTRIVHENQGEIVRFIVDFEGEALTALPENTGLSSIVSTPHQVQLLEKHLMKNPGTGGWRLDFKVRVPHNDSVMQSIVSARDGSPPLRFQALLKKGENLPDPLTESWVFDLPSQ